MTPRTAKPVLVEHRTSFRVLSFRWGQGPGHSSVGWRRLADQRFGSRAAAERFARLRVESGAITGAAVFKERHVRAGESGDAQPLSRHGRLPDNLET